ncbi:MAG: regulatory protein GemA [Campylobacteraceae bacterium]|jgi:hypothetical protein|nr:regulatory protein GemA [Campylobacteraceae bacterium]
MTPQQKKLHAHLIKICHTLKKIRFPDDETRKDYLHSRYNKESFKELTIDELKEVAGFLGFKHKTYKKPETEHINPPSKQFATKPQIEIIEDIWYKIAEKKTALALRQFIKRIMQKDYLILYLEHLSAKEAQKVITALSAMQKKWSKKYASK